MRELLFHKIWNADCLNYKQLESTCGSKINILDGGKYNTGDGPDFSNACITIDGLKLHGSIELHINCQDWYQHKHHTDARYNRVILHVVLTNETVTPVRRSDGSTVPTISLHHKIPKNFAALLRELGHQESLSCNGILKSISPDVFHNQLNLASELYFQHKVKEILKYYDSSLPPSEAWKKMLFIAWSDGLGIPKNRENMAELAQYGWEKISQAPIGQMYNQLLDYAGLGKNITAFNTMKKSHWDYSGSRPGNRPEIRVQHLTMFLHHLRNTPFGSILLTNPQELFNSISSPRFAGAQRSRTLRLTVVLPSIYLLGQLFHRNQLQEFAVSTWLNSTMHIPESILKPYLSAGISRSLIQNNPGIVFQSRHFCKEKQCSECFVFKNALGG